MSSVPSRSASFAHVPGILLSFLAVVAVVAACKTTGPRTLSLEEAREVSASFEGGSFVPPPRTVTDVLQVVRSGTGEAESQRAEWLRRASAEPPAGAGAGALIAFYRDRAGARGFLGRTQEQIADLERAVELAEGRGDERSDALQALSVANIHVGNYRRGLEQRYASISALSADRSAPRVSRNAALGIFLAKLGQFSAARAALEKAQQEESAVARRRGGREWIGLLRSMVRVGESSIAMAQGRYAEAESALREADRLLARDIEAGVDSREGAMGWGLANTLRFSRAYVQRDLAEALLHQGRLIEAEVAARGAIETAVEHFGRLSIITAEVLPMLGQVLLEQGRALDAEKIDREAVAIYREMGVPGENLFYNRARVALAEALAAQRKWPEVISIYREIDRDLSDDREMFRHFFAANASWAMAEIATGNAGATVARLGPALERHRQSLGDKHLVTAETRGLLAAALTARGEAGRARPLFGEAFAILSSNSRDSAEEGVTQTARNRRLAFILESYLDALAAGGGNDETLDRSMRVAGLAHGRSVQQAVLAAAARATVSDPALADLVRREQDARKQIGALNGVLANVMTAPPDQRAASGEEELRVQISELRAARAALAQEIERRYPDYAALINPKPPGVAETQAALAPGEALVATYVGERASYVWAVPDSGRARFASVPRDRLAVHATVARLRGALDPRAETLGDIPAFDVGLANDLYRDFLAPVRGAWQGAQNLLVVADGPLGQLPMGVLVTERVSQPSDRRLLFEGYAAVPWLARDHAVTVLPSVASLTALRSLPAGRPGRRPFVGFGDPVFRPGGTRVAATTDAVQARAGDAVLASRGMPLNLRSLPQTRNMSSARLDMLPPLPDTADEIRSIALAMDADLTRDVFLGAAANERQVKTLDLSGYRVVAFATHGLVPGDLDGLTQPALALSNPAAAGGAGDGLLTMEEILSLRLDADWVVLSACNTGTGRGAGAEAVSGLGRAFFYAGTRSLLVSNWPVETTSAKALTTDIFRRQAERPGLDRAAALRQAMIGLMDGPGYVDPGTDTAIFSYAHPIFWAPFSLIGDGGARGSGT